MPTSSSGGLSTLTTNGHLNEGGAWLFLGSAAGADTTPDWSGEGNAQNAYFGYAVAGAGDVNGDGYDDALIGVPGRNQARLHLGGAGGLSPVAAWTAFGSGSFGFSVAGAGDVNRDGFADVIVGAVNDSNDQLLEGRAFLYLGSAAGPASVPAWSGEGDQAGAHYGRSVGGAGDVNGDGFADVIVGAPEFANAEVGEGRALVYLGSPAGLGTAAAWTAESDQPDTYFGFWVDSAGDVNGDGCAEVIVGATWYADQFPDDGRAYVYLGSAAGLAPDPHWTMTGHHEELGFTVAGAGDVNGDGFDDVIVGGPHHADPDYAEGAAFVLLGSAAGLPPNPDWTAQGNMREAHFGQAVAGAGDVNGDGAADVLIGAPFSHCPEYPPCGPIPGFAAVYNGIRAPTAAGGGAPRQRGLELTIEPNPFSRAARVRYAIPETGGVTLDVFDAAGRTVSSLFSGPQARGEYAMTWAGTAGDHAALRRGVYFIRLRNATATAVRKIVIVR